MAAAQLAPLSLLARPQPATPIIGRQASLSRLRAAWDRAVAGARQVFWVAGEAGVGKTTLIEHFVAALGPVVCVHGQCVEQVGAGEPYLPVLEALAELSRADPALTPLLRTVAPTWLLQLPWLSNEAERASLQRELAGTSQDRMLRELGELLDRYTASRPLLLVTEDLHWSDQATVHLINHIARRRGPARLMWLASFRLAEVIAEDHPLKSLRHELRLHRLCEEILLDPFSEQEIADFIAGRVPDVELPESFVRALHARTDGLPLFVTNVVDDLLAQGALNSAAGNAAPELRIESFAVPENLAGILEKQIARLTPDLRALLEAASVCGVEFRPDAVADALERGTDWVTARCDGLTHQQQWLNSASLDRQADGALVARYEFRHALYRHVFYDRLGELARAQLHRRIGAALQRVQAAGGDVSAAELALHAERGHEPMHALRHYAAAAEKALRQFAPREAMSLTAHALTLLPQCPAGPARDALELALSALRGLGAAQALGISSVEAKTGIGRACALLDTLPQHPLAGVVLQALGLVHFVRGEYRETRVIGERLLAISRASGDRSALITACNLLGQLDTIQGRPHDAVRLLEQGVAACEELGDVALKAAFVVDPGVTLYGVIALSLLHIGRADRAQAMLDHAFDRARLFGQPMAELVVSWFNALTDVRRGHVERVAQLARRMQTLYEDAGLAQGYGPSRWYRGWAAAQCGSPREGFALIRAGFDHNAALGMSAGGAEVLGYAAEALLLAGDWQGAQTQLDEAMQLVSRLDERAYLPQLQVLQGRILAARGDSAAARAQMLKGLQVARDQGAIWTELTVLVALCERDGAQKADLDALADVLARLNEGLDTPLVARGKDLLHSRKRPAGRRR